MTECTVCLQTLRPPVRVLSCGHSFCAGCLRGIRRACGVYNVDDATVSVQCPNCRQETRLVEGRISNLPTNYALNELLEAEANAQNNAQTNQQVQQTETANDNDETSSVYYANIRATAMNVASQAQSSVAAATSTPTASPTTSPTTASLPTSSVVQTASSSSLTYSEATHHEPFYDEAGVYHFCRTCQTNERQQQNGVDVVVDVEVDDAGSNPSEAELSSTTTEAEESSESVASSTTTTTEAEELSEIDCNKSSTASSYSQSSESCY